MECASLPWPELTKGIATVWIENANDRKRRERDACIVLIGIAIQLGLIVLVVLSGMVWLIIEMVQHLRWI